MKKKILTLILVLFSWIISTNAQTLKFLPDNTEKSILVFKQSVSGDTLVFLKKVVVPEILADSFTTGKLVTFLNQNESNSFIYEISLLSKSVIQSKYYILPPASFDTYNYKGMYFSPKELSFKAFEYQKVIPGTTFNGNLIKGFFVLILVTLLSTVVMFIFKIILAIHLGIRTLHDFVIYLSLYLLLSMAFSDVTSGTLFNPSIMILLILPTTISVLIAHFLTEKKFGYTRIS